MEWLVFLIVAAATIVPMWRLCERDGLNPIWSLVCIIPLGPVVPLGLLILLWVLAFRTPERLV
jgi:hypothetical protein